MKKESIFIILSIVVMLTFSSYFYADFDNNLSGNAIHTESAYSDNIKSPPSHDTGQSDIKYADENAGYSDVTHQKRHISSDYRVQEQKDKGIRELFLKRGAVEDDIMGLQKSKNDIQYRTEEEYLQELREVMLDMKEKGCKSNLYSCIPKEKEEDPKPKKDINQYIQISAGESHTCGVRRFDGRVLCWGSNEFGQLGWGGKKENVGSVLFGTYNIEMEEKSRITKKPTEITDRKPYREVSAGDYHTCGVREDGRLLCWGFNRYRSVLGNDDPENYNFSWELDGIGFSKTLPDVISQTPVFVDDESEYIQVSAGNHHNCAIREDGQVLCWGLSLEGGELGTGQGMRSHSAKPTHVKDDEPYQDISAGESHTCGIRSSGELLCWGSNLKGQLGLGEDVRYTDVPTIVDSSSKYLGVSAGNDFTCAVREDGRTLCWGNNHLSRLGNTEKVTDYNLFYEDNIIYNPVLIADPEPYTRISSGQMFSCGIQTDGNLYCWGFMLGGDITSGPSMMQNKDAISFSQGFHTKPDLFMPYDDILDFSIGGDHGCYIMKGTYVVKCWGHNNLGQLGDNSLRSRGDVRTIYLDSEENYGMLGLGGGSQ